MINKGKNILILIFAVFFTLILTSCGESVKDLFNYSDESFSAEVEGSVDGIFIKATVSFEKPQDAKTDRVMTVRYHSPESLKGLTVSIYSDGTAKSRLGEIELINGTFGDLAFPFLSIRPEGNFTSINYDGEGNATVLFSDSERNLKYFFKNDVSLPQKIEGLTMGRQISLRICEK